MVDLLSNDGHGECTCADWVFTCRENLKELNEGGRVREYMRQDGRNQDRTQCKHIYISKLKFANDTFKAMAAERKTQ